MPGSDNLTRVKKLRYLRDYSTASLVTRMAYADILILLNESDSKANPRETISTIKISKNQ